MNDLVLKVRNSPVLIRVVPFAVFLLFTSAQGKFFPNSQYWLYLIKILLGAVLIWWMRPLVAEMRWRCSWEAVFVGIAVFVMWVGIDPYYPKLPGHGSSVWNPFTAYASDPAVAWFIAVGRIAGMTLIVPPLEEVFYRSFLYRYLIKPEFNQLPLNVYHPLMFLAAAVVFGLSHFEWLAGILCAFAYGGLVIRKNRLGDAMTAHAITNLLLGIYIVWKEAWNFW